MRPALRDGDLVLTLADARDVKSLPGRKTDVSDVQWFIGSSGLDTNGHVAQAVGARVQQFVLKPYTAEVLLRALRKILGEPARLP